GWVRDPDAVLENTALRAAFLMRGASAQHGSRERRRQDLGLHNSRRASREENKKGSRNQTPHAPSVPLRGAPSKRDAVLPQGRRCYLTDGDPVVFVSGCRKRTRSRLTTVMAINSSANAFSGWSAARTEDVSRRFTSRTWRKISTIRSRVRSISFFGS